MATLSWDLVTRYRSGGLDDMREDMEDLPETAQSAAKGIGIALGAAGAAGAGLLAMGFAQNIEIEQGRAKLAAQLGLTTDEAAKVGKAAAQVYGENFGENMDQVNEAIKAIGDNFGDVGKMSQDELKGMTEQALTLSSVMGTDLALNTEAAAAMVKNGLAKNAKEAFDIIAAGSQNGVNKADDLLETFQEYSPQFSKLGIKGKDALNLLSAGLKAGARDTDVIADGFKELGIRVIDGSDSTKQAFKDIGLNAKETAAEFGKGGDAAREATDNVIQGLLGIKDPLKRNQAGVALFGTQWEDTFQKILPALKDTRGQITDVDGATQRMADTVGNTAASRIETMKRKFEQWTQSMASSDGALGLVTTGATQFGGQALEMGSQLGIAAVAFRGTAAAAMVSTVATNAAAGAAKALRLAWIAATGPVGLVVIGVLALGTALVVAHKKSEKFRAVVNAVFRTVANFVLGAIQKIIHVFGSLFGVLGKLPGSAGRAFRAAARSAKNAERAVGNLKDELNGLPSIKHVRVEYREVFISERKRDASAAPGRIGARAAGGPVAGGVPYWVGEQGPELIVPSRAGTVLSASQSAMAVKKTISMGDGSKYFGGTGNTYNVFKIHIGTNMQSGREIREAIDEAWNRAPAGSKPPMKATRPKQKGAMKAVQPAMRARRG